MPKLRAVEPGEKPQKKMSVVEAAAQGDHRQMLIALQARVARSVEATSTNPVALAALTRQLVLISKELSVLDATGDDPIAEAARTADEEWSAI
ncbi:MAG: hypothetical protein ACJ72M_06995 [Propionibacteriaceae bacterium]|jgi:hypothetical protein